MKDRIFKGTIEFMRMCRDADIDDFDLELTLSRTWPIEHVKKIIACNAPFCGGFFGEIRDIAELFEAHGKHCDKVKLWNLFDQDMKK